MGIGSGYGYWVSAWYKCKSNDILKASMMINRAYSNVYRYNSLRSQCEISMDIERDKKTKKILE